MVIQNIRKNSLKYAMHFSIFSYFSKKQYLKKMKE